MCELEKYGTFRIDPCIQDEIDRINSSERYKTRASCCGHGKYPITIIVEDKKTGIVFEYFTGEFFDSKYKNGRCRKRFYRKDVSGYYYIPGIKE